MWNRVVAYGNPAWRIACTIAVVRLRTFSEIKFDYSYIYLFTRNSYGKINSNARDSKTYSLINYT